MRKFNLGLGVFFAIQVVWSLFTDDSPTDRILFFELNIWVVRAIWALLAFVMIYGYFKPSSTK
ncbi:MAG: hypothetical protein HRT65_09985 [Flavobacteriaceae bacterium]|nr:hypothetical protein [Flavobacteriaceae bacterium]